MYVSQIVSAILLAICITTALAQEVDDYWNTRQLNHRCASLSSNYTNFDEVIEKHRHRGEIWRLLGLKTYVAEPGLDELACDKYSENDRKKHMWKGQCETFTQNWLVDYARWEKDHMVPYMSNCCLFFHHDPECGGKVVGSFSAYNEKKCVNIAEVTQSVKLWCPKADSGADGGVGGALPKGSHQSEDADDKKRVRRAF